MPFRPMTLLALLKRYLFHDIDNWNDESHSQILLISPQSDLRNSKASRQNNLRAAEAANRPPIESAKRDEIRRPSQVEEIAGINICQPG